MEKPVAIVADFKEEHWRSMDLVADMLAVELARNPSSIRAQRICPDFIVRTAHLPGLRTLNSAGMVDRLLNRYWDYPRWLRSMRSQFAAYHVIDHSYAHLVHQLPADRTIVSCHDLDAFRLLWEPSRTLDRTLLSPLLKRTLSGLQSAAIVTCGSSAVEHQLLERNLVAPNRIRVVHYGVHPECSPKPDSIADDELERLAGARQTETAELLHVGSTIPRKRIDVLLRILAKARNSIKKDLKLLRIGGDLTAEQKDLVRELRLGSCIVCLPSLSWPLLAAAYRRADLCLQPSEAEGFGLPIVEALACGTPVIASDLAVLREVGGDAAVYCRVADIEEWVATVNLLLQEKDSNQSDWILRRRRALARAAGFTWSKFAVSMSQLYSELLQADSGNGSRFQSACLNGNS